MRGSGWRFEVESAVALFGLRGARVGLRGCGIGRRIRGGRGRVIGGGRGGCGRRLRWISLAEWWCLGLRHVVLFGIDLLPKNLIIGCLCCCSRRFVAHILSCPKVVPMYVILFGHPTQSRRI